MKKLSYLLGLLLIGGFIFSACSKDEDEEPQDLTPSIEFAAGGTDTIIVAGDSVLVSVICASNSISGKKLDTYEIYMIIDNENTGAIVEVTDIDENAYAVAYYITFPDPLEGKLYAKITDVDGESSQLSFNITVEEGTTPLEGEQELTWQRVGGAAGTGLDMFGLKWTSNVKEVMAVIQKDGADKFVQLDAEAWTNILTKEDLMAAVDAAEDLGDYGYRGVSAEANGEYNDVLATLFNNEYYLIQISNGTVEVDPVTGTTITISGMYNK
jgi:hypothetical protein